VWRRRRQRSGPGSRADRRGAGLQTARRSDFSAQRKSVFEVSVPGFPGFGVAASIRPDKLNNVRAHGRNFSGLLRSLRVLRK